MVRTEISIREDTVIDGMIISEDTEGQRKHREISKELPRITSPVSPRNITRI